VKDTLPEVPTAAELRDALAEMLAGAAGGAVEIWRKAIGEVEMLSLAFDPRSNWRVTPTGTKAQQAAIASAVEIVREAHPYVMPDGT
jgi:hypothetical protein